MKASISRRSLIKAGALTRASSALLRVPALGAPAQARGKPSPIQLGLASYTFRNFTREQMIGFMKLINVKSLNVKDVKDHLPADEQGEATALADYAAAGVKLHAAGAIHFRKDEQKFP